MTTRQSKQQPKQKQQMQSSLPETDKVALTDAELEENTTVEEVTNEMTPAIAEEVSKEMAEDLQKEKEALMRKEMMAEIKKELLAELASEHEQKLAMVQAERDKNNMERTKYVAKMKNSSEPWVDWVSAISDENGVGMELDWNDAYVDFLRANGVTGTDDDAIVHKYVTILLRQGADAIDEEFEDKSKFEG